MALSLLETMVAANSLCLQVSARRHSHRRRRRRRRRRRHHHHQQLSLPALQTQWPLPQRVPYHLFYYCSYPALQTQRPLPPSFGCSCRVDKAMVAAQVERHSPTALSNSSL